MRVWVCGALISTVSIPKKSTYHLRVFEGMIVKVIKDQRASKVFPLN